MFQFADAKLANEGQKLMVGEVGQTPDVQLHPIGPFDLIRIEWSNVEVESLHCQNADFDTSARLDNGDSDKSIWKVNPCVASAVRIVGRDAQGRRRVFVKDFSPCLRDGTDWFVRMRFSEAASNWGTIAEAVVELVNTAEGRSEEVLPPDIMSVQMRVGRLSQPAITRPLFMLSPLVISSIDRIREQANFVVADFKQREKHNNVSDTEIEQFLLSEAARLSHINETGIRRIRAAEWEERVEAGRMLDAIRASRPPQFAQYAEREYWPKALSSLVARRLGVEQVLEAGLGPQSRQMRLEPLRLAAADTLRIINPHARIALQVELPGGEPRWARHAVVRIEQGRMVWSDEDDHLAEDEIAQTLLGLTAGSDERSRLIPVSRAHPAIGWPEKIERKLQRLGLILSDEQRADLEFLSRIDPIDTWVSDRAKPSEEALSAGVETGLNAPELWVRSDMPQSVRRKVLAILKNNKWAALPSIDLDRYDQLGAFGSIPAVELVNVAAALSQEDRLKEALGSQVGKLGLEMSDEIEGFAVGLLLIVGLDIRFGEPFIAELAQNNTEAAVGIVKEMLDDAPNTLKLVVDE